MQRPFHVIITQGVLASKYPIFVQTQTQDQHRNQKIRKMLKNHVPISAFATMLLNLKKKIKSYKKITKKNFFS